MPGEWKVCSLPGLQDSDQAGDEWTSCRGAGSYGATGMKTTPEQQQQQQQEKCILNVCRTNEMVVDFKRRSGAV